MNQSSRKNSNARCLLLVTKTGFTMDGTQQLFLPWDILWDTQICKSYYAHAINKTKAIEQIININYSDRDAVEIFLQESKYYQEKIDKATLIDNFQKLRPVIVKVEPFMNPDSVVDSSIKKMKIMFSKPMKPGHSFTMSQKGKEHYPITGPAEYSDDNQTLTVSIDLKPNQSYEFFLTDRSFIATDGYRLLRCSIAFKTK